MHSTYIPQIIFYSFYFHNNDLFFSKIQINFWRIQLSINLYGQKQATHSIESLIHYFNSSFLDIR